MLRDVPYCKSILACGLGGLILSVVMLTWVYPLFQMKASEVKEIKVREYMEDRYGISDRGGAIVRGQSGEDRELSKAVQPQTSAAPSVPLDGADPEVEDASAEPAPDDEALPLAKQR
jgi:hypothetical protein